MDYQKLILRIKCPEIRECPFQEPMSCALRAYSEQVANNGNSTKKVRNLIRRLKAELDLRKIYQKED